MISTLAAKRYAKRVSDLAENGAMEGLTNVVTLVSGVLLETGGGLRAVLYALTLPEVVYALGSDYFSHEDTLLTDDDFESIADSVRSLSERERHLLACDLIDLAVDYEMRTTPDVSYVDSVTVAMALAVQVLPPASDELKIRTRHFDYFKLLYHILYYDVRVRMGEEKSREDEYGDIMVKGIAEMTAHLRALWNAPAA